MFFYLLSLGLRWPPLFLAFGFDGTSFHALLLIIAFLSGPFTFLFTPLRNIWSRRNEYQADRYAFRHGGGADPMKRALLRLGKDNLSQLKPHPAYSAWYYSHPALPERIAALDAL